MCECFELIWDAVGVGYISVVDCLGTGVKEGGEGNKGSAALLEERLLRGIVAGFLGLSESFGKTSHTVSHSFSNFFFNKVVPLVSLKRKEILGVMKLFLLPGFFRY